MLNAGNQNFKIAIFGWIIGLLILLMPGGVLTQIWTAKYRIAGRYTASPLGEVCYYCGRPATHAQRYTNGEVLYFCDKHKPPDEIWSSYGTHLPHGNGYNPVFCTIFVLAIYLGNLIYMLVSFFNGRRKGAVSVRGAGWGIFWAVVFWLWFHSR